MALLENGDHLAVLVDSARQGRARIKQLERKVQELLDENRHIFVALKVGVSGDTTCTPHTTPRKVNPVILHGVVSAEGQQVSQQAS